MNALSQSSEWLLWVNEVNECFESVKWMIALSQWSEWMLWVNEVNHCFESMKWMKDSTKWSEIPHQVNKRTNESDWQKKDKEKCRNAFVNDDG